MATMPQEPGAFAGKVAHQIRSMQPTFAVEHTESLELVVNGRRLNLENVWRMVNHEPSRGTEIVEQYLGNIFPEDAPDLNSVTFDFARLRIMPRLQPLTIFEHLNQAHVAHVPFVNDTVVVFVIDFPTMTVSVTTEQLVRWGLSAQEVDDLARCNLADYERDPELQIVTSKEGGKAALYNCRDGYDAARLLLSDLHSRLAPQLGSEFHVGIPARDIFVAFSGSRGFVDRVRGRLAHDYHRLPYAITPRLFLVTRDGISGTPGD